MWYVKAGIKRAWMPAGATVLFGEWGQYNDSLPGFAPPSGNEDIVGGNDCASFLPIGVARTKRHAGTQHFKNGDP